MKEEWTMDYLSYLLPVAVLVGLFLLMRRRGAGMGGCCGMGHMGETHEKHHPQTKGKETPPEKPVLVERSPGQEARTEKARES